MFTFPSWYLKAPSVSIEILSRSVQFDLIELDSQLNIARFAWDPHRSPDFKFHQSIFTTENPTNKLHTIIHSFISSIRFNYSIIAHRKDTLWEKVWRAIHSMIQFSKEERDKVIYAIKRFYAAPVWMTRGQHFFFDTIHLTSFCSFPMTNPFRFSFFQIQYILLDWFNSRNYK